MMTLEKDFPLVTEEGETFLTEEQVLRFVREKCGAEVASLFEKAIAVNENAKKAVPALERAEEILKMAEDAIEELGSGLKNAEKLIEKALG